MQTQTKIHIAITVFFTLFSFLFFVAIFFDNSSMIEHVGFVLSSLITFVLIKFTPQKN